MNMAAVNLVAVNVAVVVSATSSAVADRGTGALSGVDPRNSSGTGG